MKPLTHLSLFTGIGGIDLAAEYAGFESVCQCEWADFPTTVLEKHWPDVPRFRDITTLTKEAFYERTGRNTVTLISGGFPCQPFSSAGKRDGFADERYLWPEMCRIIRELRPRWVLGENVAGFINMGLDKTLVDLAKAGYRIWTFVLPALAVGAWHERKRTFIVGVDISHTPCVRFWQRHETPDYTNEFQRGFSQGKPKRNRLGSEIISSGVLLGNTGTDYTGDCEKTASGRQKNVEPGLGGMAHGLPPEMDGRIIWEREPQSIPRLIPDRPNRANRLKTLGNAVVPPQVYPILKYISDIETGRCREWCVCEPIGGDEP